MENSPPINDIPPPPPPPHSNGQRGPNYGAILDKVLETYAGGFNKPCQVEMSNENGDVCPVMISPVQSIMNLTQAVAELTEAVSELTDAVDDAGFEEEEERPRRKQNKRRR